MTMNKRGVVAIAAGAVLMAGCTTSAAGLERGRLRMTVDSPKSPQAFATCSADTMIGNVQLRGEGDHWWVLRFNGYGVPVTRWDFRAKPGGGTTAELRSSIPINTGDERVRNCV
ncbi:MAG: hypothetical protein ACK4K7_03165 [Allosphingosinicella sp.]|uniref:hypothetical protein n=1 Tax=Allosphingosinicella sp. TaxID=2823234 RepID=UPI003962E6CD